MAATGSTPARSGVDAGASTDSPGVPTPAGPPVAGPPGTDAPVAGPPLGGPPVGGPPVGAAPVPNTQPSDDWASQAADTVERIVGSIRAKTAGPLETVAYALVYGLVALIVGGAAAVLGAVLLVRVLDIVIPGGVWSAHAITGGIFTLAGLFLWRKRTVKTVRV